MHIRGLTEEGEPLAGAKLYSSALRPRDAKGERSFNRDSVADANGEIVLSLPKRAVLLRLWPQMPGYVSEFMNYDLGIHEEGALIHLRLLHHITDL